MRRQSRRPQLNDAQRPTGAIFTGLPNAQKIARAMAALGLIAAGASAEPTARFGDVGAPPAPAGVGPAKAASAPVADPTRQERRTPPPRQPPKSWATRAAMEYVHQAERRVANSDLAGALRAYTDAIQMDPSYGPAYLGIGGLRERMADFVEAERVYSVALRLRGVANIALARRALLRHRLGRKAAAFADLEKAVQRGRSAGMHGRILAGWYVERQAWPAALALWRRILAEHDSDPESDQAREARVQVHALTLLAATSDPVVVGGADHPSWVRRALASMARRGPVLRQR